MNSSKQRRRALAAVLTSLALAAAACGGDDDDAGESPETAAAQPEETSAPDAPATDAPATTAASDDGADEPASESTAPGSSPADAPELALDGPVKIALLIPMTGPSAIPQVFEDPMETAVAEINAAGGIGGFPVEYSTYDTGFTPEEGTVALRKALEGDPTVLMGYAITSQVLAASDLLNEAQIPLIHFSAADETNISEGGSPWTFRVKLENSSQAAASAQFLMDELGARKFGIMYTNSAYGTTARDAAQAVIEAGGGEVIADRSYAQEATDLTEQVLAMEGADVVLNWGFPNTIGLQLNQMYQNGIDIPTMDSDSAVLTYENQLADPEAMTKFYGAVVCNPSGDERQSARDWAAAFQEEYGYDPDANSAFTYDSVYLYKLAIEAAGSAEGEAIKTALETLTWDGGVCQPEYKSDENHNLSHDVSIVFLGGGERETVAVTRG